MISHAGWSARHNVGAFIIALAILIGGTWTAVRVTTDHLLYQDAASIARSWAKFLAGSITDLEQIADDCTVFRNGRKVAELFDKYNLRSLPIIDREKHLVGVVHAEQVIALLRASH